MTGLLLGLLAAVCVVLAVRGTIMARNPGTVAEEGGALIPMAETDDRRLIAKLTVKYALRFSPWLMARTGPESLLKVQRRLDYAGHPDDTTLEEFIGTRVVMAIFAVAFTLLLLVVTGGAWYSAFGLLMVLYPDAWLRNEERKRQNRIERQLPDVLDVLAVTVSAGLSYRAALSRVTAEMPGPASTELDRTVHEIDLGVGRREAFMRLRDRNSARVLRRYVVAQTQADEFGASLATAITQIAGETRQMHEQNVRRIAQRRGTFMVMAGIMLGMPLLLIAMGGAILFGVGFLGGEGVSLIPKAP